MPTRTPSPPWGHRLGSGVSAIRVPFVDGVEEPACKPDSVPAARLAPAAGGGHLSGSRVTAALVQPTREHRAGHPLPAWPCSGRGLPSRPVARPLVSSYLTVSPLPLPTAFPPQPVRPRGPRGPKA